MRLLLDTHTFLWFLSGHRSLSPRARRSVETARNEKYLSIASVWEMAIKHGLGKLKLAVSLRDTIDAGVDECGIALLAVERDHALSVAELPWHHDDPFDRLLVAQARAEGLHIVSRDEAFDHYGVLRVW